MHKQIFLFILVLFTYSITVYGQKESSKINDTSINKVFYETEEAQSLDNVLVKDADGNTLMQVNDEGAAGSIEFNSVGALSSFTNKLYNNSGNLYWNGNLLGSSGGSAGGGWVDDEINNYVKLVDELEPVCIGYFSDKTPATLSVTGYDGVIFKGRYGWGTPLDLGEGIRMMWYPKNAAFRAGAVTGTQWDDANIGQYSIAMGSDALASGNYSTAIGRTTTASGMYSVALGFQTTTSGNYSTAMGSGGTSSGDYSTAMGVRTTASGMYSTAMGYETTASGMYSTALGKNTKAEAYFSTAIGTYNVGGGNPTIWVNSDPLFEVGIGDAATGKNALTLLKSGWLGLGTSSPLSLLHVNGNDGVLFEGTFGSGNTLARGAGTRMIWYSRKAAFRAGYTDGTQWDDDGTPSSNVGDYSVAFGKNTKASGIGAFALGESSIASNRYAIAMGNNCSASQYASFAIGQNANASNSETVAMGNYTTASGIYSVAIGNHTTASSYSSTAIGSYNIGGGSPTQWNDSDPLFEIGNGRNESNKNNAFTILKDGRVGINTSSPTRTLSVDGDAGGLTSWYNDSDRRLKKNIITIPNPLDKISMLRGVNFEWKDTENHSDGTQMGFIAQEANEVIPEVVDDSGEYFSMQYAPITALLVEAVKEQNKEFRSQNAELKKRVEQLEKIVAGLADVRNKTRVTGALQ